MQISPTNIFAPVSTPAESIFGLFWIGSFKADSPRPAVDMINEVNQAVSQAGFSQIGILGTRTEMETRFYGGVRPSFRPADRI